MSSVSDRGHLLRKRLKAVACTKFLSETNDTLDRVPDGPGMNQVVLMPNLANSLSRRGAPTSPANMPCAAGGEPPVLDERAGDVPWICPTPSLGLRRNLATPAETCGEGVHGGAEVK